MFRERSAITTVAWTANKTFTWTANSRTWAQSVPLTWTRHALILHDRNMGFAQHRHSGNNM